MATSKTELFDERLVEDAAFFKALAHPARLQILQFLAETKSCFTGDISDELPLGRTTVNQHLKELKNSGLIIGQISGSKTNYCLDTELIARLNSRINHFLNCLDKEGTNCC
ncbi:MAG: helix-turn-helix transcriptional regulator [Chlorobi bacterium]|nr:helix-turn-helix transcriptional regulator [Chlorobiota bacterium]